MSVYGIDDCTSNLGAVNNIYFAVSKELPMGCLALFLNFLFPGLGTVLFTNKRVQGFIQLALAVVNLILIFISLGLWGIVGGFIHLGLFVWSLAATISFMGEQSAKKAMQEERARYENNQ
jgi:threonine/homoserine efflux transporter RhtA